MKSRTTICIIKNVCVRKYLRISHQATILAVFWCLNCFLSSVCNCCQLIQLILRPSNFRKRESLVFSVTPFKIDENKNKNRSIDKVQNLGNERRYISKDPRQDSGQRNISYTRYPKKCFTQIYAMLVLTWMSSNMADGNH